MEITRVGWKIVGIDGTGRDLSLKS